MTSSTALVFLAALAGCGDKDGDTGHDHDHDSHTDGGTDGGTTDGGTTEGGTTGGTDGGTDGETSGEPVVTACNGVTPATRDGGDGSWHTELDASDADGWACFDFAGDGASWDLAFQQWTIRMNSGTSGEGSVAGVALEGEDYDELEVAPAAEQFAEDGDSLLFEEWYDYDPSTHVLTPADVVYVIKASDGAWYKLEMLSYYGLEDLSEDIHTPAFRWAEVAAP